MEHLLETFETKNDEPNNSTSHHFSKIVENFAKIQEPRISTKTTSTKDPERSCKTANQSKQKGMRFLTTLSRFHFFFYFVLFFMLVYDFSCDMNRSCVTRARKSFSGCAECRRTRRRSQIFTVKKMQVWGLRDHITTRRLWENRKTTNPKYLKHVHAEERKC